MPTYTNSGQNRAALKDGTQIGPGESLQKYENFLTLPAGVTKTSDLPVWNPVIISSRNTGNSGTDTVTIPTAVNGKDVETFNLDIFCSAGRVSIKFNDSSFSPPIILASGEGYSEEITFRKITSILVTYEVASSVCKVDVLFR